MIITLRPSLLSRYFDRVDAKPRCFSHTVRRYYPVANLTRTRQAVIVEPLRPEHFFVRTFNATSLYILSICEVRVHSELLFFRVRLNSYPRLSEIAPISGRG